MLFMIIFFIFFFFQAEDGIRDKLVTGVQTCALPISGAAAGVSYGVCAPGCGGTINRRNGTGFGTEHSGGEIPAAAGAPAAAGISPPECSVPKPVPFLRLIVPPHPGAQTPYETPAAALGSCESRCPAIPPGYTSAPDWDSNPLPRAEPSHPRS